jgi:hypothetical protein
MSENKIFIGIDPDVTKSGFAFKNGKVVELYNYTFFELFERLKFYKEREVKPTVYIECGFLNKGNWHKTIGSNSVNAQIGQRTGANHEVAKKIVEMCQYLDLPYVEVRPTKSKVNDVFFRQITKINQRTNQEQRDAMMLIHGLK